MDLSRRILCFILYGGLAVLAEATLPGHSTCIASSSASTPVTAPTSTTPSFPSTPPPIVYQWLYGLVAPDWDGMNCSLPAATDSDMDPLERWEQLKVEDAWNAAVDNWNTKGNDGATQFSQSLGSFFEYTETLFCENLADNDGCSNLQVKCDEFNHPAGYMIVLSMIWLERVSHSYFHETIVLINVLSNTWELIALSPRAVMLFPSSFRICLGSLPL